MKLPFSLTDYVCNLFSVVAISNYTITSDPPRLRTGEMLIPKCYFTILRMLYTYKPSSWITLIY
jgi:hypothetical protein